MTLPNNNRLPLSFPTSPEGEAQHIQGDELSKDKEESSKTLSWP